MTQRVFVDANVLAKRTCLDWLWQLRTHNEGMFQLHATEDVFVEAHRVMRKRHPRAGGNLISDKLEKFRACIDEVLDDFPAEGRFSGADEGDYHVHAAAISSRADIILTFNESGDFTQTPDDEPYEILCPDEFFMLVTDSQPRCLLPITRGQVEYWSSRPSSAQLDDALERADCPMFAARVRDTLKHLALHG